MSIEKFNSSLEKKQNKREVDPEEELQKILEGNDLPEEIRKRLEGDLIEDRKPPQEILEETKHILKRRAELHSEFPEMPPKEKIYNENLEQEEEKTKQKLKKITQEALEDKIESIGSGTTAKVVVSDQDANFCYKVITNVNNYRKGNDVKQETEFLDKLTDIEGIHTRVPKPYSYEMNKQGHLYTMERLNAVSLQEILDGAQPLPAEFDVQAFFQDLEEFIKKMHQKGVYHRDLSNPGNIMVDKNTGMPYIIDFGASTKSKGSSEDPYRKTNANGDMVTYADDLESIKEHKKTIQNTFKKINN